MLYKLIAILSSIAICIVFANKINSNILEVNSKAPPFKAIDHNEETIALKDFLGKYVVIYFFPRSFTPGWTKQACGFRDKYDDYKKNNINVLGISYDPPKKLKKFKEKHNLPFTFISDKDKNITKLYNSSGFFFPARKTIVINPNGYIIDIIEDIKIDTHASDIIDRVLKDLETKK